MRNLKRTLSLVMAMALIVGMMVVSASAVSSDFNDSAEITNTEAVDVMTAIGVFEGTDKGAFNPTGILTREQAAKIVAVMLLGEEDASKLTTNSTTFKDVAANRWSAGYIGYCVQQGILAGTGNGNFDPEGELTGLAFAKMMLVALGYDPAIEQYVGNDWAINTNVLANQNGLYKKLSNLNANTLLTRDNAAQMIYNALDANMVELNAAGNYTTSQYSYTGTESVVTGTERVWVVKIKDLSQIVLEMLASLNAMNKRKDRLIEITADGKISDDELEDFLYIQEELERISITVETLQLWAEKMLATGVIDEARYEAYRSRKKT